MNPESSGIIDTAFLTCLQTSKLTKIADAIWRSLCLIVENFLNRASEEVLLRFTQNFGNVTLKSKVSFES